MGNKQQTTNNNNSSQRQQQTATTTTTTTTTTTILPERSVFSPVPGFSCDASQYPHFVGGGGASSTKYPNDSSRPPTPSFPPYDVRTLHFVECGRPWLLHRCMDTLTWCDNIFWTLA